MLWRALLQQDLLAVLLLAARSVCQLHHRLHRYGQQQQWQQSAQTVACMFA
jgi:hypothetical protein